MRPEDLILVSVDDHVVEPPDVFERHLPAKFKDAAPKLVRKPSGIDVWQCQGQVTTRRGKPYNNRYCYVCRFGDDGCMHELIEYFDTELVSAALEAPGTA